MKWSDYTQAAGLAVINAIARSLPVRREQVPYGAESRHFLDWYRHADLADTRPTVVFFYGGNWRSGRRQDYRFVADTLMTLGCDVIVPDYRLYPSVRFQHILDDARLAMETVFKLLPAGAPIVLMGHSAGAQLGALLTLNRDLLTAPERISGFVGLAGPYDFFPFTEDDHWELFGPEEHYPVSQPVNYVRADAPPLYLLHGEDDHRVRRGHSKSLMEKQITTGGVASREVYPGMGHVDIIVAFSRLHRRRSKVVSDVGAFVQGIAQGRIS
ncbi:MAG: alpha/beta hydrolase [Pseudomonadota bacterium]